MFLLGFMRSGTTLLEQVLAANSDVVALEEKGLLIEPGDQYLSSVPALDYLARGGSPGLIFDAARRMIYHKGRDSHDYKYGAAIGEEVLLSSAPAWRNPLIASAMFNLPGAGTKDSPTMIRAREAVATVLKG